MVRTADQDSSGTPPIRGVLVDPGLDLEGLHIPPGLGAPRGPPPEELDSVAAEKESWSKLLPLQPDVG